MTFNRNRQQPLSRLNLESLMLRHCAINRGFEGWVSSLTIDSCGHASREAICEFVCVKSRWSMGKHSVGFVLANLAVGCQM